MRLVIHTKRGMFERKVSEKCLDELQTVLQEAAMTNDQPLCIRTDTTALVIGADLLCSAVYEILED